MKINLKIRSAFRGSLLLVLALFTTAAARPAEVRNAGFSEERLHRIHEMVEARIAAGSLSGAVAIVSRDGRIVYFDAQGLRDVETKQPMARDSIFRLCSMTKPVIGTAVLMLVEEGKLRLTDRVSTFIPEFKTMRVVASQSASIVESGSAPSPTVPAGREITVRDLLTHTSGIGSGPISVAAIKRLERKPSEILSEFIPRLASVPLEFQPGTRWHYSGSAGFDTLGRIVEIVAGRRLDQFLAERLFKPLGMMDTTFAPSAEQRTCLVTNYEATASGLIKVKDQEEPLNPVYLGGSGGLASTAGDYFRFAQMLAGGGELDRKRILSPRMVEVMRSVQVPDTFPGRPRGEAWGLSMRVMSDGSAGGSLLSTGSFGWSGAFGTHFWVDPREKLVALFMIQLRNAGGSGAQTARDFETAVMQSLVELRGDATRPFLDGH